MEQLTVTDWLFFFCCSEKKKQTILKNIKKNNDFIKGIHPKLKSKQDTKYINVLCNKPNIKSKHYLKGKLVRLIIMILLLKTKM